MLPDSFLAESNIYRLVVYVAVVALVVVWFDHRAIPGVRWTVWAAAILAVSGGMWVLYTGEFDWINDLAQLTSVGIPFIIPAVVAIVGLLWVADGAYARRGRRVTPPSQDELDALTTCRGDDTTGDPNHRIHRRDHTLLTDSVIAPARRYGRRHSAVDIAMIAHTRMPAAPSLGGRRPCVGSKGGRNT